MTTMPRITPRMTDDPGVRFGIANGLLVTTFIAASVARLDHTMTAMTVVLAAALLGAGLSLTMATSLGVIAWAWYTGFVENRLGQLTFAGEDCQRLVLFTLPAVAVALLIGVARGDAAGAAD